ncbi:MAG: hypothetical protein L6Q99_13850 [Planctomycetes bacterium]|nr:hypothetical protein [Planctomycetota bacterium]
MQPTRSPEPRPDPRPDPGPKPRVRLRIALAFGLALAADALFIWTEFVPPVAIVVDLGVATGLFFLLGARWSLLPVLLVEILPVTAAFPTWTLAVTALASLRRR